MAETQDGKWRATATEVFPATIDKVWAVLADFDGLRRSFPQIIASCDTVEGEPNKVGSLRLVTAPVPPPNGTLVEARERLLTLDDVNHTTSYCIEKTDMGWTGYVAHITAESLENGQTLAKWSYELNPVSGVPEEEYRQRQTALFGQGLQIVKEIVAK